MGTWYLTTDNEVTKTLSDKVARPTMTEVYIYDEEQAANQEDKPSLDDIAKDQLKGNSYSHEISCKVRRDNHILPVDQIKVGLLVDIVYDNVKYQSVLSGYRIEENTYVELNFGHIRSRLGEYME